MTGFSWFAFLTGLLVALLWTVFLYRMRGGYFRLIGSNQTTSLFKTSLGEFRIDSKHGRLQMKTADKGWAGITIDEIQELSFQRDESASWLNELLTGFNIWDFSGRYRDQVITCTIDIIRTDGTAIPLYTASQLEEREFWLWGSWVRLVRWVLERVKLSTNVDSHSLAVFEQLKDEFRRHGARV